MKKLFTLLIIVCAAVAEHTVFAQTVTTVSSGLSNPLGMALNGNTLYIGEWGGGRISKIDITQPLPVPVTTILSGLINPTGITIIGNYMYICAENNLPGLTTAVGRIDLNLPTPVIEAVTTNINSTYIPQGFVRNGNDLYISTSGNSATGGIFRLDLGAPFPQMATALITNFPCSGMALRGNDLYVGLFNGNTLYKMDISQPNPTPVTVLSGLAGPDGLAFNGNYLYLCEATGTTIKRIDVTAPTPVAQNVVTGLAEPTYVAFDGVDLYFAQYGGGVVSRLTINQPVLPAIPLVCSNTVPGNLGGASPTGGIYSGPGVTDKGDVQTFTFDPAAAGGPGSYTVTYSIGSGSATANISVSAAPAVSFSLPSNISVNAGVQTLNGAPAGGTYSGPGITGTSFDPAAAGPGTHTISYTYADASGCGATVSASIAVVASGCLVASPSLPQFPAATFEPACTGLPEVIVANAWTGEYSKVAVSAGMQYTFSSSVSGDLVTIADKNGSTVYSYGASSVTWTAATTDTVRFYLHLDSLCNWGDNVDRSRIVMCQVAQCPPGSVTLHTQAEVNQFIIDYPNCTEILGNLQIGGSGSNIVNLNGLSNITIVHGNMAVFEADQLQNLAGLNLTQVNDFLEFYDNPQLLNVDGLSSLTQVGGPLGFSGNSVLQNLNGLSSITAINGDLALIDNPALTDISGLSNINPATIADIAGYGLYIEDNLLLQVCHLPNLCAYLANPAATHPRTITGNAGDCISEPAVKSACTVSLDEQDNAVLVVFPNPVKDILTLNYTKNIQYVSVINMLGQTLSTKTADAPAVQLDMSALPAGTYMVKVGFGNSSKLVKIVKE